MNILELDCVLGSFSNTRLYIDKLKESASRFFPDIRFITYIGDGPVNVNMGHLREEFLKTQKRFWVYLDHDVLFLNQTIIRDALTTLVSNKGIGLVTVYSSHNPKYMVQPYNTDGLMEGTVPWSIGYFLMIDSARVGHIVPDMSLPSPNYAIDVSFSLEVRKAGYDIGISPNYVYHQKKGNPQHDEYTTRITDEYFFKKYGQFYRDCYQPVNINLP
jgi:hypothetical protein